MKNTPKPSIKGPSKASNLKSYKFLPSKEYVAPTPAKKAVVSKVVAKIAPKTSVKPIRKINLPEVTVTATRIKKPIERKPIDEKVRLYPKGEASKKSVDSLKRIGFGKAIGEPIKIKGQVSQYGPAASDVIKKKLNKK